MEKENYFQKKYMQDCARGRPSFMGLNEQYGRSAYSDVPMRTWQNMKFPDYYQNYSNTMSANNNEIPAAPQWLSPMKLYKLPQGAPRFCEHAVTFRQVGGNLYPQQMCLKCNAPLESDEYENGNALNNNNGAGTLLSAPKMIAVAPRVVPFANLEQTNNVKSAMNASMQKGNYLSRVVSEIVALEERQLNQLTNGDLNNQQPVQGNSNYKINQWNPAGEGSSYDESFPSVPSHVSGTLKVPQQNTTPNSNNAVANKKNARKNRPRPRRSRGRSLNATEHTSKREFDKILRATTRNMDTKSLIVQHPLCPRSHIKYALSIAKFNYLKADVILKIAKLTRPGLEHIVNVLTLNHLMQAPGQAPENCNNE